MIPLKQIDISPDLFSKPTLFFDGICVLCDHSVRWIMKRDKNKRIKYEILQSDLGKIILNKIPSHFISTETVIFISDGKIFLYSDASLEVLKILGGFYGLLGQLGLMVTPTLRNRVYRFIAKNRYSWFGKKNTCEI